MFDFLFFFYIYSLIVGVGGVGVVHGVGMEVRGQPAGVISFLPIQSWGSNSSPQS